MKKTDEYMNKVADKAWELYCEETAGDMDVRDDWDQLHKSVEILYLNKVFKLIDEGKLVIE